MKVREEIEKLQGPIYFRQDAVPQHRDMLFRDEVLSILDKRLGEFAGGHTFTSHELAELYIFDGLYPPGRARTIEFKHGDRISIYVRRK